MVYALRGRGKGTFSMAASTGLLAHFFDWLNKTYKQKLDEFFTNEDLKALLCALLGYLGTKPEETGQAVL